MNEQLFITAFEEMRANNRGKQFERRELGLLASQHGIYFNSTMWAAGLGRFFNVGKVGPRFIYSFKNTAIDAAEVHLFAADVYAYKHSNIRTIEHAKNILRRFGINEVN